MAVTITEQKYGPTTGSVTGWVGVVLCVGGVVSSLTDPTTGRVRVALVVAMLGVVFWSYLIRPRVLVREPTTLLLRNAFSTWEVPLAGVTRIRVTAFTRVHVGEQGYDGIGVGRRVRTMVRGAVLRHGDGIAGAGRAIGGLPHRERKQPAAHTPEAIADLMTEQVLAASERAKEGGQPTEPVLRHWAWVELALLAALGIGFAVSYLV